MGLLPQWMTLEVMNRKNPSAISRSYGVFSKHGIINDRFGSRLVKMYQKIEVFTWLLGYFAARSFNFSSDNVRSLYHDKLSQRDKELFNFDLSSIDWSEYMRIYYLGTRKYLMKDDPSTIPAARVKYNR